MLLSRTRSRTSCRVQRRFATRAFEHLEPRCLLNADGGEVVGWGDNAYGQADSPAGHDFVAVSGGGNHSLALRADSSLIAWGDNWYGQTNVPVGNDFVAIAAGGYHNLALRADGSIVGWGRNEYGETDVPAGNDFVAIAAMGWTGSLALKEDGSLVAWGSYPSVPAGNDYVAIAAGFYHGLALQMDGSLVAWGLNWHGQTDVPAGDDFVAIAAAAEHNIALKADGSLVGWGDNAHGQTTVPVGNDFVAIATGGLGAWGADHSLALRADGSLAGWGDNTYGQADVPTGNDFVAIAAGGFHSLAIMTPWLPVDLDIKPGSDANPINLNANGVIPITVFTTEDFDAAWVDLDTVQFAGASPAHWAFEDVDGDDDLDLVLHFRLEDTDLLTQYEDLIRDDMEDGSLDDNHKVVDACLTGKASETGDDVFDFLGSDSVDIFLTGKKLRDLLATL